MRKALGIIAASLLSSVGIVALEFAGWLKAVQGSDQGADRNFVAGALIGIWLLTFILVLGTLRSSMADERTSPDTDDDYRGGGR